MDLEQMQRLVIDKLEHANSLRVKGQRPSEEALKASREVMDMLEQLRTMLWLKFHHDRSVA